jgi:hypothetical protein
MRAAPLPPRTVICVRQADLLADLAPHPEYVFSMDEDSGTATSTSNPAASARTVPQPARPSQAARPARSPLADWSAPIEAPVLRCEPSRVVVGFRLAAG